jgi:hypothetical protein
MGGLSVGLAPEWLALREEADAEARAAGLLEPLRERLSGNLVIHDLGCGTGSMGRWLAGRLPGPQHWILHDRDQDLLARAAISLPDPVTVTAAPGDLAHLSASDLAAASLVTASALLDLLTADEVAGLAAACITAGCPALLTLSVLGRVELDPADSLDEALAAAFNDHQRRDLGGRRQLGPNAFDVAAEEFARGAVMYRQPSPWRLGPADAGLIEEWLRGWVAAAVEQRPRLATESERYLNRRLEANTAGELRVVVTHGDLLAIPEAG